MVAKIKAAVFVLMTLGASVSSAGPDDQAFEGSRCGGRAASERLGGK
jgi:hypothetical protein